MEYIQSIILQFRYVKKKLTKKWSTTVKSETTKILKILIEKSQSKCQIKSSNTLNEWITNVIQLTLYTLCDNLNHFQNQHKCQQRKTKIAYRQNT